MRIDNPTFEKISAVSDRKREKPVICSMFHNTTIELRAYRMGRAKRRANIDIDLWRDELNLKPEVQERLCAEYSRYVDDVYRPHIPKGGMTWTFGNAVIHFEVLEEHAEEWFSKVWSILMDKKNLKKVDPFDFLKQFRPKDE